MPQRPDLPWTEPFSYSGPGRGSGCGVGGEGWRVVEDQVFPSESLKGERARAVLVWSPSSSHKAASASSTGPEPRPGAQSHSHFYQPMGWHLCLGKGLSLVWAVIPPTALISSLLLELTSSHTLHGASRGRFLATRDQPTWGLPAFRPQRGHPDVLLLIGFSLPGSSLSIAFGRHDLG